MYRYMYTRVFFKFYFDVFLLLSLRTRPVLPKLQNCVHGQVGGILPSRYGRAACRVSRVAGVQISFSYAVDKTIYIGLNRLRYILGGHKKY